MKTINIGNQSFSSIRENGYFYIDKTDFIREWWEAADVSTLIMRPHRFGKTLNMDMLNCFFSKKYAGRADLFEGLSIWEEKDENGEYVYRKIQGEYPVIFVSFADIKENTFQKTYRKICEKLTALYEEYADILEKERFKRVAPDMDKVTASTVLNDLCAGLSHYYGKNVILLMDEYDAPMQTAYENGYWDELSWFFRGMFLSAFKVNPYLERGLMVGVTRANKENMFSDLNNLQIVTATSNKYETVFGFTEEEVFAALDVFGMGEQKEKIREWYGGFTFGKHTDIYNPWSICQLLKEKEFDTYWGNTSFNNLINTVIQQGNVYAKQGMENLLAGKHLIMEIDEQVSFDHLDQYQDAIWGMMLAGGYLKVIHYEFTSWGDFSYELAITNLEVQILLKDMIQGWFDDCHYNDFIKALLLENIDAMNEHMNKITMRTFSSFNRGKNVSMEYDAEYFYHGFVLGMMVNLADRYHIVSNRESGFGRYDVMLKPKDKVKNAIIIEFKIHRTKREASMEDTLQAALSQIQEKRYDEDLIAEGYSPEKIRHYGFAFRGKEVLIGKAVTET